MPENERLNSSIDQIELCFVEREATPEFLMKLSIQLHLSGLSLSNTVRVCEVFGVQRARSTVHNWIHKADLQPESGKNPDHVAVDETVIRFNNERYWLYAPVDPETNELLHTSLEPTTNTVIAQTFLAEINEKHDVSDAVFLIDGSQSLYSPTEILIHSGRINLFYQVLSNNFDSIIIILDEIVLLLGRRRNPDYEPAYSKLLYQLSRASHLGRIGGHVSVAAITNDPRFMQNPDGRAESSFNPHSDYDENQLQAILKRRKDAYQDNVLNNGIIPLSAALAAQDHGDA